MITYVFWRIRLNHRDNSVQTQYPYACMIGQKRIGHSLYGMNINATDNNRQKPLTLLVVIVLVDFFLVKESDMYSLTKIVIYCKSVTVIFPDSPKNTNPCCKHLKYITRKWHNNVTSITMKNSIV